MKKLLLAGWTVIGLASLLGMCWLDLWLAGAGQASAWVQLYRHPDWFWGPPLAAAVWSVVVLLVSCWRDEPRDR